MTDAPQRTRGFQLGRAFGGRIIVQPSTLLMLVLLAFLFSTGGGAELTRRGFTIGLILAVLLFVSVFLHELSHAATAKALGREVHEVVITLWGGHTSFDARGLTPRDNGLTAAAGPVTNLVISGIAYALLATGLFDVTLIDLVGGDITGYLIIQYIAIANLILAVFNALPGIPMDGGRVLESIVWAVTKDRWKGVIIAAWGGRSIAVGVVLFALGAPLAQGRTPQLFDVMWAGLIALILWPAASQALRAAQHLSKREVVTAGSVMVPAIAVPYTSSVDDALAAATRSGAREVVVTGADGAVAGHFPVAVGQAVPAESRGATTLTSVLMPTPRGCEVSPTLGGEELVGALREWWGRTDGWVVVEHGRPVGVARLSDVTEALQ
ncbi:site-2 protease family protein [Demequina sp. NBRC 110053]|uniref:site-2 protease family protein n=1 Tax=Demequina sp. NBRC 110053 TaxID=1570342 RepID=UPI000A076E48|nr:site-2 protease family protein [Demequina sp. NBRC 110053]